MGKKWCIDVVQRVIVLFNWPPRRKPNSFTNATEWCFFLGFFEVHRGGCPKSATGLNIIIGFSSKSMWVPRLLFCQNVSFRGWVKKSTQTFLSLEAISYARVLQSIEISCLLSNFPILKEI